MDLDGPSHLSHGTVGYESDGTVDSHGQATCPMVQWDPI